MNWSRRSAYTSLELFLVHERRNVITPLAAQPTALSEAVGCAWPAIVSGGGLRTARKTTLVAVDGGGGLGMLRRMTFFPVDGGGGLHMAPRRTSFFRSVGGGLVGMATGGRRHRRGSEASRRHDAVSGMKTDAVLNRSMG
jgi:hypothetical protein